MKQLLIKFQVLMLVMFCGYCTFAQTVSNVTAEQVGTTIHVSYDLDKAADISLFVSMDGGGSFTQLYKVSGDVGKTIGPGHKTIVWDVQAEVKGLDCDSIVFKIRAQGFSKENLSITVNGVPFKMIFVEGGIYIMGCTSEQGEDCYGSEKPAHSVTVSDFYMGETEVTQALWKAVMGSNPSSFKSDNLPVENVSWNDCQEFVKKLNQLTGKIFRLPTEAEWEYAARGGKNHSGYKYSGSNSIGDVAWYWGNSGSKTYSVKSKKPNALGLYDMSGNVWEWCLDWYENYSSAAQADPIGLSSGTRRVLRGGGWYNGVGSCRVSCRNDSNSDNRCNDFGFRLAMGLKSVGVE